MLTSFRFLIALIFVSAVTVVAHAESESAPVYGDPDRVDIWRFRDTLNQASHETSRIANPNATTAVERGAYHQGSSGYLEGHTYSQSNKWLPTEEMPYYEDHDLGPELQTCKDILELKSRKTLEYMFERGVITAQMMALQLQVNADLDPTQPTFLHAWNITDAATLIKKYGKIPDFAAKSEKNTGYFSRFNGFEDTNPEYLEEAGTLWIINGFVLDQKALKRGEKKVIPKALPLKLGRGKELLVKFDVEEGSRNFEIGHVTTRARGSLPSMLGHAAALMYFDVRDTGGDAAKAYVNAHALDRAHRIIYQYHYKMPVYKSDLPGSETAFRKNLLDFINDTKPSEYIAGLKAFKRGSGGRFSEVEMLEMYYRAKRRESRYLDYESTTMRSYYPVAVRDFSNLQREADISNLRARGLSALKARWAADQLPHNPEHTELDRLREARVNGGKMFDQFDGVENYRKFLSENNAIEITNVDTWLAAHHPEQIRDTIIGVYNFTLKNLREQGVADPKKFLRDHRIQFVMTEDYPGDIMAALKEFEPAETYIFSQSEVVSIGNFFYDGDIMQEPKNVWALHLKPEKIEAEIERLKALDPAGAARFDLPAFESHHETNRKLFDPDHF